MLAVIQFMNMGVGYLQHPIGGYLKVIEDSCGDTKSLLYRGFWKFVPVCISNLNGVLY